MLPSTDRWLQWGERIDAMRVVPRIIMLTVYAFFIQGWWYVVTWFMNYPWTTITNDAVALALAAFPAAILGVLTQVVNSLTKAYWEGGRKWDQPPEDPK